jgi:hypothetical protein
VAQALKNVHGVSLEKGRMQIAECVIKFVKGAKIPIKLQTPNYSPLEKNATLET